MIMRTPATTIRKWWNAKSETFSRLGDGDTYTHGQVVMMHLLYLIFVFVTIILSFMEGGAS